VKNSIRINTANGDNGYQRNTDERGLPADDGRFIENNIPVKATAVSTAQNDSGVFELSFRDERYLPFEGAGVISDWSLELFSDLPANNPNPMNPDFGKPLRQFDYGTITDAIVQIRYTAREDAGLFKNNAIAHLREHYARDGATPSLRMFNLRQEFPSQWQRFLYPTNAASGNVFELEMAPNLFPLRDKEKTLRINSIWFLARSRNNGNYQVVITPPGPPPLPAGSNTLTLTRLPKYGNLHYALKSTSAIPPAVPLFTTSIDLSVAPEKWQFRTTRPGGGNLQEDPVTKIMEVEDAYLVIGYDWG
jgi:Tc toxin complex TcA C-terminal TcB-binding domain